MIKPYFSLIIPIFNAAKYLDKCLTSIVNQSFIDFEVILINDGSTDESLFICNGYVELHGNFKVLCKENEGVSSARNAGINEANGNYIWFIDSDDFIEQEALQILYNNLKKSNIDMLGFSNYHYFEDQDRIVENKINRKTDVLSPKLFFSEGNVFETAPWIMVINRELITKNNIKFHEELVIYEDNLFMMTCLSKSNKIQYIDDFLYYYLIRKNSLTSQNKSQKIRIKGYFELLKFSTKALQESDFKEYWNDNIYTLYNSIYSIYFNLNLEDKKRYKSNIEELKNRKLKIGSNDVFGIKVMKVLHNLCFPIYKFKLFKS